MKKVLIAAGVVVAALMSSMAPANAQSGPTCQEISDTYGTNHSVTWGTAPQNIRNIWIANGCRTRPSGYTMMSCQDISDTYGTWHSVTWGSATSAVKDMWHGQGCRTTPSHINVLECQDLSDEFGITHNVTWGTAGELQKNMWYSQGCTTSPRAQRFSVEIVVVDMSGDGRYTLRAVGNFPTGSEISWGIIDPTTGELTTQFLDCSVDMFDEQVQFTKLNARGACRVKVEVLTGRGPEGISTDTIELGYFDVSSED